MTQPHIVGKLEAMLLKGITTEEEALALMVRVRKLLEHQKEKKQYEYLTFHCDWALHPTLTGTTAQKILTMFDAANIHLKAGTKLKDLPPQIGRDIDRISKMTYFEEQLEGFLKANGLPNMDSVRSDGWAHFLHLYTKVIEESPLEMNAQNTSAGVASVTLKVDFADLSKLDSDDMWYKVRWTIEDKNGRSGEVFVLNSFSLNPQKEPSY
jgi:hypothetical protein